MCLMLTGCFTDKQCVCPDLWAPVCGINGRTYANACEAECDDVDYIDGECPVYGIGQVTFSGDSICGYYIHILNTTYKPQNLPEGLAEDDITVGLRYRRMNLFFTCDDPYGNYQEILILEIDKIQ